VTPRTARGVLAAAASQVESFFLEPVDPGSPTPAPVTALHEPAVAPAERTGVPPAAAPPQRAAPLPAAAPPLGPWPLPTAAPALVSPAGPVTPVPDAPPEAAALRPVVAVFGLARRCGGTVVSRALAAELAGRDQAGVAAVASPAAVGGIPLATPAAGRLAGALEDVPGASTTAVGRLCLVEGADEHALADTARYFAPLVIDAGSVEVDGAAAGIADRVVLVAAPGVEPALARVAAECVRRVGPEPLVVRNRADRGDDAGLRLPDSRMGAQLALGGRQARGELGRAIAALADLCEAAW
jgi:hypothetical protein